MAQRTVPRVGVLALVLAWGWPVLAGAQAPARDGASEDGPFATHRADGEVSASLGGFFQGLGVGIDIAVGRYLSSSVAIDLAGSLGVGIPDARYEAVDAGLRVFFNDRGYLRLGAQLRHADAAKFQLFSDDQKEIEERYIETDVGPEFGIGHQLQWQDLVLEVTWVSVYIPVVALTGGKRLVARDTGEILAVVDDSLVAVAQIRFLHFRMGATL